ncbi:hypothetical protein TW86_13420 [Halomonas sp. S2151]|uniref:helix-turn-helix domain-containing protein n=1 Tax=Halomonas sp. S2151 TaxID=579478 RepID=UPI0005FA56B0|nr:helix-turn-helix domain-containing protein [Halomonas sp. S2151]KJZ11107.1 hypothetical protein TW86_13420 [Halomonas sp. S2151]
MNDIIETSKPTMSSREIAELTGKRHEHVMRDIRIMAARLYIEPGELFSPTEAEKMFGKTRKTFYRHIESGELRAASLGQPTRIEFRELMRKYREPSKDHPKLGFDEIQGLSIDRDEEGRKVGYSLDRYHTETLVTGYDVKRRAAVIKRWYALETGAAQPIAAKPASRAELILQQAQALVEHERRLEDLEREQEDQRRKMRETECQLRAITEGEEFFTVSAYCSLHGYPVSSEAASKIGKAASAVCRDRGLPTGKAKHPRFGTVKTYPREALKQAAPFMESQA